jgi:ubiquitin-conjugating enzyme E2 U
MFEWRATVSGPKETDWEGGLFQLRMRFLPEYNCKPPSVVFMTIPFHPNIDMDTGKPCMDLLDDPSCWSEKLHGVKYILLSLQTMLASPVLESPVNADAARCFASSPRMYRQMVLDCVVASRRVAAGLPAHEEEEEKKRKAAEYSAMKLVQDGQQTSPKIKPRKFTKVSFDDYHILWRGLATTQPAGMVISPLIQLLRKDAALKAVHLGPSQQALHKDIDDKIHQFRDLKYGCLNGLPQKQGGKGQAHADKKQLKTQLRDPRRFKEERMQMLRHLYINGGEEKEKNSENENMARDSQHRTKIPSDQVQMTACTETEETVADISCESVGSMEISIRSHSADAGEGELEAEAEELLTWTDCLTDDVLDM